MSATTPRVCLLILDGWGLNKAYPGNAITEAHPQNWEQIWQTYPHIQLQASGEAVGLPEGQMGNSEVGHEAIGSGRVVPQTMLELNQAAKNGTFHERPAFGKLFADLKTRSGSLHIMGLLSPGGVHSHEEHIFGLVREARAAGIERVYVHAFTDGRDVAPQSCLTSFEKLAAVCQETGAEIASIAGRFFAMDRDKNLERTNLAYEAVRNRKGQLFASYQEAVEASYADGKNDEYISPRLLAVRDESRAAIVQGDGVIFANFRNDRPRQLTEAFIAGGLDGISFVTMTPYSDKYPVEVAFTYPVVTNTFGEVLAAHNVPIFKVTETEKYPHVTFFMNGRREAPLAGEDRQLIPSNKVEIHAQMPEMKAAEISAAIVEAMESGKYQAIVANICNGDMVGHSGDVEAAKKAVLAVDKGLKAVEAAALANNFVLFVTADHGNCDEMIGEHGEVITEHSTNPVPFILIQPQESQLKLKTDVTEPKLADIAPTLLKVLGLAQPVEMTGRALVE